MVECLTADPARAAAAVREAFMNHGGHLGAAGSVAYLFKEVGRLVYPRGAGLGLRLNLIWDAGAEDVVVCRDGSVEVLTDPLELDEVRSRLAPAASEPPVASVTYQSAVKVRLSTAQAASLAQLRRALGKLDGVRSIYTNAENADELLESI